jgi:hypothetical protein
VTSVLGVQSERGTADWSSWPNGARRRGAPRRGCMSCSAVNPTDRELAAELDMPVDRVQQLRETDQAVTSLDAPIGDHGAALQDFLEDHSAVGPDDLAVETVGREALEQVLQALPELSTWKDEPPWLAPSAWRPATDLVPYAERPPGGRRSTSPAVRCRDRRGRGGGQSSLAFSRRTTAARARMKVGWVLGSSIRWKAMPASSASSRAATSRS